MGNDGNGRAGKVNSSGRKKQATGKSAHQHDSSCYYRLCDYGLDNIES